MKLIEECSYPKDWKHIKAVSEADRSPGTWAVVYENVLKARLGTRYLEPIKRLNGPGQGEGFSILTVQCALLEFLASLRKGWNFKYGHPEHGKDHFYSDSQKLFVDFLRQEHPFKEFFTKKQARDFYSNIRCGLVHEAQTKAGWRVWRGDPSRPLVDRQQKVVYRDRMSACIDQYLVKYSEYLIDSSEYQDAFIRKFDYLYKNIERTERKAE